MCQLYHQPGIPSSIRRTHGKANYAGCTCMIPVLLLCSGRWRQDGSQELWAAILPPLKVQRQMTPEHHLVTWTAMP